MRARAQRRKKIDRYLNWLARNHPHSKAPECIVREHNRQARRYNTRMGREIRDDGSE